MVDAAGLHPDQHVGRADLGVGDVRILHRLGGPVFVERRSFHLPVTSASEWGPEPAVSKTNRSTLRRELARGSGVPGGRRGCSEDTSAAPGRIWAVSGNCLRTLRSHGAP